MRSSRILLALAVGIVILASGPMARAQRRIEVGGAGKPATRPSVEENRTSALVKLQLAKGTTVVGKLISEGETGVTILDIRRNRRRVFERKSLLGIVRDVGQEEAVAHAGLPLYMAWRYWHDQQAESEALARPKAVAVLPFEVTGEKESALSKSLVSSFITAFRLYGVVVVERSALDRVLRELKLQSTSLVDQNSAQRVGRLLGADALLAGNILRTGKIPELHVRVVRVQTGVVMLSGSQRLSAGSLEPGSPSIPGGLAAASFINSIGMKFVYIKRGTFTMGSPASELKREDDETQHRVRISKGFYLGAYEVTQAQYKAVMGANPAHFKKGGNYPVEMINWNDAVTFCKKLSAKEGKTYRLPTEAEWEYACRAGTTTPFAFGQTISTDRANYDGNYIYGSGRKGVLRKATMPVGSFRPNAWGLHDMHGNVWEWCGDWYGKDYYGQASATDPRGPSSGPSRVLRGGSWLNYPVRCRSADRNSSSPDTRSTYLGFRVVCEPSSARYSP